ncbi:MAG: hypothetical protein FWE22_04005 [Firmicutes bacterium]|nr:hypothetical protein [Bacillota bacterium]
MSFAAKTIGNRSPQKKKKKRSCLGHLVRFIIAMIIIFLILTIAAFIVGNVFTRRYLDMSIFDTLGVVRDLGRARENRIITNSYTNQDQQAFEASLRRQLFLTDDAPLNLEELLMAILGTSGGDENLNEHYSNQELPIWENYIVYAFHIASGDIPDNFATNPFVEYITNLYSYQGGRFINREALALYDINIHQNYILNIQDRELAAFMNAVLQAGLRDIATIAEIPALTALKEIADIDTLEDKIVIEQIRFFGTEENVNLSVTVSVAPREVARGAIYNAIGRRFETLTRWFLPERFFVTVNSSLNDGYATVVINEMDETRMARLYHMVDAIMELSGNSNFSAEETIKEFSSPFIEIVRDAIDNYGHTNQIENGRLSVDVINTLITVTNFNYNYQYTRGEGRYLRSTHVILALRYILTSDFYESINEDIAWQNLHYRVVGDRTYLTRNPENYEGIIWNRHDFEQEFLDELQRTLPLNLTGEKCDNEYCEVYRCGELTFSELISMFGIGVDNQNEALFRFFDSAGLYRLSNEENIEDLRIQISNRLLGFLVDYAINHIFNMEDAGIISLMRPTLYQLRIFTAEEYNRTYLEAALALNLFAAFEQTGFQDVIASVLSSRIMIFFTLDITSGIDVEHSSPTLTFNDLTRAEFVDFLDILNRFGLDMSEEDLFVWIETPMREMLSEMIYRMPHLGLGVSDTIAIEFDDVFQMLVDNALTRYDYLCDECGKRFCEEECEGERVMTRQVASYVWEENDPQEITNRKLQLLVRALFEMPYKPETSYENMELKENIQTIMDLKLREEGEEAPFPIPRMDTFKNIVSLSRAYCPENGSKLIMVAGFETGKLFADGAVNYETVFGMPYIFVTMTFYLDNAAPSPPPPGIPYISATPPIYGVTQGFRGFHRYEFSYQFNTMCNRQKTQLYAIIHFFNYGLSDALQINERIGDISGFLWLLNNYSDAEWMPDIF